MRLVLLSGGSGKRLWPISSDARSKQFLKVLEREDGIKQSMVERIWGQLQAVGLSNSSVVSTSKAQSSMLKDQLGQEIPLVLEPERRDTFPAIALAASYLFSVQQVNLDEVIAVLPVDAYVHDSFFEKIKSLEGILLSTDAELALMGVKPVIPSEKYGYIVPEDPSLNEDYYKIKRFQEKPSQGHAKELIKEGALWNCGIFAFQLRKVIMLLKEKGLATDYESLVNQYSQLPKISFDYEVVEKTENAIVIPYEGFWKDLGTWNTLTEEMGSTLLGKGAISDDSLNTHVINELDIPIAVLGLSDVVVAASPNGILVSDKAASPRVKEISGFDQPPIYQEKHWGWYKVLDYTTTPDGQEVVTKRICIKKGKNISYHFHCKRAEVWMVIGGVGEFIIDGEIGQVNVGSMIQVPAETRHAIKAITDLELIEIQTGKEVMEEDIVRVAMEWEEILFEAVKNLCSP
ncbi:sugar phosphate nucleotidyltransferase [Paenibacillus xanthanilyticus]|uniref:Sugar phosphate nucleotidyltransferase n=1 Tax=Paenibacillus xanthanilyticus TaxID=1783531 RepID=A0ABV8K318_9BACL